MQMYSEELNRIIEAYNDFNTLNRVRLTMETDKGKLDVAQRALNTVLNQIYRFVTKDKTQYRMYLEALKDSHGDIDKIPQFKVTLECLTLLRKSKDKKVKESADEIFKLYNYLKRNKTNFMKVSQMYYKASTPFEKAFAFITFIMFWDLVSCVAYSTSILLTFTFDGIIGVDKYVIMTYVTLWNGLFEKGKVKAWLDYGTKKMDKKEVREDAIMAIAALAGVVFGLLTVALSVRVLVYYFYYTRTQLADYFEQQAHFLNIHKSEIKGNKELTAKEKDSIIEAQKKWADRFMALSEFIAVDDIQSAKKVEKETKVANNEVNSSVVNTPNDGMDFF